MSGFDRKPRTGIPAEAAIIRAGTKLRQPLYWTQGAVARAANGREVEPNDRSAVAWSLDGIMYWVHRLATDDFDKASFNNMAEDYASLSLCSSRLFRLTPTQVNDFEDIEVAHRQVLEVLRHAVKRARISAYEQGLTA